MRRSPLLLTLAASLATATTGGCALNFDQFVDGSRAMMDVVPTPFEGGADTNPATGCPYPWLLLGVAGPESSTLERYSVTTAATLRCTDFTGMPPQLDHFASIAPLRYAVVNASDIWIVDATRPDAALPVAHLADTIATTVFTLYHATVPYVVVPYRGTDGGSSIRVVRIIDTSHTPFNTTDWTPSTGANGPTVSDPMVAMTLDPGVAGHVVAVSLTSTSARSIDVFGTAIDAFRMNTAGFVNTARGAWGVGVGFGLGDSNSPEFSLTDATRPTSMSSADGPHACTGACPFASRLEVVGDPTGDAHGAFVLCRQPTGLARVLRWRSSTDHCDVVTDLNDADGNGRQLVSIELVPSATRN